jgi:hypothetical protein
VHCPEQDVWSNTHIFLKAQFDRAFLSIDKPHASNLMTMEIRRLTHTQVDDAGWLLAKAFEGDPLMEA